MKEKKPANKSLNTREFEKEFFLGRGEISQWTSTFNLQTWLLVSLLSLTPSAGYCQHITAPAQQPAKPGYSWLPHTELYLMCQAGAMAVVVDAGCFAPPWVVGRIFSMMVAAATTAAAAAVSVAASWLRGRWWWAAWSFMIWVLWNKNRLKIYEMASSFTVSISKSEMSASLYRWQT